MPEIRSEGGTIVPPEETTTAGLRQSMLPATRQSMLPAIRSQVESALKETENATAGLQKLQEVTQRDIEEIARKYSGEKSSFLAAVGGGIAGAAGGVAISGALGVVVVVSGPFYGKAMRS